MLLNNRVNLHRALGGGWADPGPVMVKKGNTTTKNTKGNDAEMRGRGDAAKETAGSRH
ncbi:MAG: hypothetical protein JRD00_10210 [Deltaproteobacteria bacterium]|nr:hypothetical protein [Deltaproteobacteria bacterium]